jgi:hypothetical protein
MSPRHGRITRESRLRNFCVYRLLFLTSPNVFAQKRDVLVPTINCQACEEFGRNILPPLRKETGVVRALDEWRQQVIAGCEPHPGCKQWLTDYNLGVVASELKDLADDGDTSAIPETHLFQALLCFELTEACPTGMRGTTMHRFQPVGAKQDEVEVVFYSKLQKNENVDIFWVDPNLGDSKPGGKIGTLKPGGVLTRNSYRGHIFRLVRPKAKFNSKSGVAVDITLGHQNSQKYDIYLNESFVYDMETYVSDAEALLPEEWNEEEDGKWLPPVIKNPLSRENLLYIVNKVGVSDVGEVGSNYAQVQVATIPVSSKKASHGRLNEKRRRGKKKKTKRKKTTAAAASTTISTTMTTTYPVSGEL